MTHRSTPRWTLAIGVVLAVVLGGAAGSAQQLEQSARAFESRLYAPCCYGGTLDVHESDLARALRKEIEGRIARGETIAAIQSDFVARYGKKVLAARSETPARTAGALLFVMAALAAVALAVALRRWTRREAVPVGAAAAVRDELDDGVDAELRDLDG